MLLRIATIALFAHLLLAEVMPDRTALRSELNWQRYVFLRESGLSELSRIIADMNRR